MKIIQVIFGEAYFETSICPRLYIDYNPLWVTSIAKFIKIGTRGSVQKINEFPLVFLPNLI